MTISPRLFSVLGVVLLGALLLGLWAAGPARAMDDAPLNPMKALDRATLKGFLEKPLFDPARRLPPVEPPAVVVEAPPVVAPPTPPPVLHLLGVIHGLRDIAVVHRDNDEKTIILHTGDHVDDWVVTVRPPVGVRLRSGDRVFDYAIFLKPGTGAGPVAAASTPEGRSTPSLDAALAARRRRLGRRHY